MSTRTTFPPESITLTLAQLRLSAELANEWAPCIERRPDGTKSSYVHWFPLRYDECVSWAGTKVTMRPVETSACRQAPAGSRIAGISMVRVFMTETIAFQVGALCLQCSEEFVRVQ